MTRSADIEVTTARSTGRTIGTDDRFAAGLHIDGMSCASCVGRVERTIRKVPGIATADVNLATARASLQLRPDADRTGTLAAVQAAVAKAGFGARPLATRGTETADADRSLARDLVVAALFTLPVFVIEMGGHMSPALEAALDAIIGARTVAVACFVATTIVLFGPGLRFYRKGLPALWRLAPDMNSLVVLGATAAWGFSTVSTFAPDRLPPGTAALYFDAAAMIVTLILLGRLLEARAKGRAGAAIARLVGLRAKTARVDRDGRMVDVPIEAVAIGDRVQVRPGETIPVDGTVHDGVSFVDESMITGEAAPTRKAAGAAVTGGTLNTTGSFTFVAEKVGAETMLARIIAMVEAAQGAKLPIQAMVDSVTRWFVPAVMVAAALTFCGWLAFGPQPALGLALVNAVSVLIIACPCAMGLATPVSIMVGTGRGAELGILFRRGDALQRLGDATCFAFDKTGTLTAGRPSLTDMICRDGFARADVLAAVAAAEHGSEHPIATALVAAAQADELPIAAATDFVAHAGLGITARVAGRTVTIGSDRMMRDAGIDVAVFAAQADALADAARTPLYAAIDSRLAAILAVADPVKPSATGTIAALHRLGRRTAMITGDARRTGEAMARTVGIDTVVADVLPDGKVAAVRALRDGGSIAFVGDGINDAPALAEADVGIAVGTGTDVAIESADIVLISGDLAGVAAAVALSRATMRNIRQNLVWAFGYNVVLIPVAAGALYPLAGLTLSPMLAAGAMAISSVAVLANALRLKRFARAA